MKKLIMCIMLLLTVTASIHAQKVPDVSDLSVYKAKVSSVHDGDTATMSIDIGMHLTIVENVRFAYIDAPEVTGAAKTAGLASRDVVRTLIDQKTIYIRTLSDSRDKYGRLLAEIWILNANNELIQLNKFLVDNKYAIYKNY